MRRKLIENRDRSRNTMEKYIRRNINQAYEHGEPVIVRSQVVQNDPDSIVCPVCWDDVDLEPNDPNCPSCQGSGWISNESLSGYRFSVFTRAHIRAIDDREVSTAEGIEYQPRVEFWVNFTEHELKDGDIIARIEPDDLTDPKSVKKLLGLFEVIQAVQPQLHPQVHAESSQYIMGQQVQTVMIDRSRPEYGLNLNENLKSWNLTLENPQEYQFSDTWLAMEVL